MDNALLLVGGGGHCRSVIDVLECAHIPVAGLVHGADCSLEPVLGYPALGRDEDVVALRERFPDALVTVGQVKSPSARIRLFTLLREAGFALRRVISPLSHVSSHASVNAGSIVMHHALINAGAHVGENCIINTKALVEHDCAIADHCHVSVGAILCGGVHVGAGSFIGAGAIVYPLVNIGKGCVVGMGARVLHDLPDGTLVKDSR